MASRASHVREPVLERRLLLFKAIALAIAAGTAIFGFLPGERTLTDGQVTAQAEAGGTSLLFVLVVMLAPVIVLAPRRRNASWWIAWPPLMGVFGAMAVCVVVIGAVQHTIPELPKIVVQAYLGAGSAPVVVHEDLWPKAAVVIGVGALVALFLIVLPLIVWLTRAPALVALPRAQAVG